MPNQPECKGCRAGCTSASLCTSDDKNRSYNNVQTRATTDTNGNACRPVIDNSLEKRNRRNHTSLFTFHSVALPPARPDKVHACGRTSSNLLTRHQIPEAYGSHRHEAKIKSIEEVPVVFPQHKHSRTAGEVQKQESDRCQSACNGTRNEPVTTRCRCKCLQRAAYERTSVASQTLCSQDHPTIQ